MFFDNVDWFISDRQPFPTVYRVHCQPVQLSAKKHQLSRWAVSDQSRKMITAILINKQATIVGSSNHRPFVDIQGSLFHNVRLSWTRRLSHGEAYGWDGGENDKNTTRPALVFVRRRSSSFSALVRRLLRDLSHSDARVLHWQSLVRKRLKDKESPTFLDLRFGSDLDYNITTHSINYSKSFLV